jgi:monovalent cation:proton antiporter-2 (CPA2) family protein
MQDITTIHVALFLAAAAIAAPLAKILRIGTVLGYLLAGVLIGPYGLGRLSGLGIGDIYSAQSVLHFAEFGVVLLLFLIGLELRLTRLWALRVSIFGAGGLQVAASALALGTVAWSLGVTSPAALFMGLALSLSSTAFAIQVMEENGELAARHGRLGFAILLFQDLAAIPLIALAPMFVLQKVSGEGGMAMKPAMIAFAAIAGVVIAGRFLLDHVFRLVAATRVKEALTACALLTVVVVEVVMEAAGLSASLGAFLSGVLLADSAYRHEIEANIKPFEGLLLGLFFTAIGMSLDVSLVTTRPMAVFALVAALVAIKSAVLFAVGRAQGLAARPARRLAFSLCQGGEFAFVLFTAGLAAGVLTTEQAALATVLVTLSMVATPGLLAAESWFAPKANPLGAVPDDLPDHDGHVIVAGFGRVGQIVTRVLRARHIPFTALDIDAEQIAFVSKFGAKSYFGDASRLDILEAAQAGKARAFVLAIDNVDASIRTAETVRRHFPDLPVYARSRNRRHTHQLMDLGVKIIHRETIGSSLDLTRDLLRGLGVPKAEAISTIDIFRRQDERRLIDDYQHYNDVEKLRARALKSAEELEELFAADSADLAIAEGSASKKPVASPASAPPPKNLAVG